MEYDGPSGDTYLPSMIVFDLDDCLWTPEMHELYDMPSIPVKGNLDPGAIATNERNLPRTAKLKRNKNKQDGNSFDTEMGVVGMKVAGTSQTVYLFDGARRALREIAVDPKYKGVLIAVASSSLEPTYSHACLKNIEILPGLTMRGMISYDEIGRTGHLTSRKTTHFHALHTDSQIPYDDMLFFDDCNWGDHCEDLSTAYGVIGQRTPNGMQLSEFYEGLDKFHKSKKKNEKN